MAVSFENCLVIGISSRALFDLQKENEIFEQQGLEAYASYQQEHENEVLKPGSAFPLVEALLRLNELSKERLVEVIIMSRNSADTSLRIFHSLEQYGLDLTRAALVGGRNVLPSLAAFHGDLFFSADAGDVRYAVNPNKVPGGALSASLD